MAILSLTVTEDFVNISFTVFCLYQPTGERMLGFAAFVYFRSQNAQHEKVHLLCEATESARPSPAASTV